MLATTHSATVLGVDGRPVRVEAHVASGLPGFTVVGLPDTACREARDRVRSALLSSGYSWPNRRTTVNLAPSDLRKVGSGLDVAIALAVLSADDQVPSGLLEGHAFLGELGLDGTVRPVPGTVPLVAACRRGPVVALESVHEASLVRRDVRGTSSLTELVASLAGEGPWPDPAPPPPAAPVAEGGDLAEVRGQHAARAALEVAAAGGHHLLMVGPPGAGKTMLAERLPGLLPDLDREEAMAVARIHSVAGRLVGGGRLPRRPPYRAPHHTASMVALVGGGTGMLRPGEVSLASGGVLFLDELGEFPASHLDALRQPLESGTITVSRASLSVMLPAHVLLVAATNPCPCGRGRWGVCRCGEAQLARYARRLCGPLLDRFDLRIGVGPPDPDTAFAAPAVETSEVVRRRVAGARRLAVGRGVECNRRLRGAALERAAPLAPEAERLLRDHLGRGLLTMRGLQRVRAVALTLADLTGTAPPLGSDLVEQALLLRGGEAVLGMAA